MPGPLRRARPAHERRRRAIEWERWFEGERSATAYRRELVQRTGLPPDLAWQLVEDIAGLAVERVPAALGVPALLAVSLLASRTTKASEASRALLAVILEELEPAHARAVLECLAIAWEESEQALALEQRRRIVHAELLRTLRRLRASDVPGIDALDAVLSVLE
ncbi:MAG: hypothetical protein RMK01_10880 [Thermomicrobium sp.]|nr:hypothetical protein [Thermomicrobium sp.]MDW8060566.1 hypothetical protein [Thermomicrobium sp.]